MGFNRKDENFFWESIVGDILAEAYQNMVSIRLILYTKEIAEDYL